MNEDEVAAHILRPKGVRAHFPLYAALCAIIDRCRTPFELNLDASHYIYRNITRGAAHALLRGTCAMPLS